MSIGRKLIHRGLRIGNKVVNRAPVIGNKVVRNLATANLALNKGLNKTNKILQQGKPYVGDIIPGYKEVAEIANDGTRFSNTLVKHQRRAGL